MRPSTIPLLILLGAARVAAGPTAAKPQNMTWTVNGIERHALVYAPSKSSRGKIPLVFGFHGGGDTADHFSIAGFQDAWPEAVIVYMQGRERNPGQPGGAFQNTDTSSTNPDLLFFDTVLADMRQKFRIDDARIYAAGFSNGGRFVYLLWATRSPTFASFRQTRHCFVTYCFDPRSKCSRAVTKSQNDLVCFGPSRLLVFPLESDYVFLSGSELEIRSRKQD